MDYQTRLELLKQKHKVKMAINEVIPIGTDIAIIIMALAELQAEMAWLLMEDDTDEH
jgi:hypothetical protein